jgi:uncharacterized damage-inducible protein DinB
MNEVDSREVWQRGPVAGVPPLLQPVAHAILQTREDVQRSMEGFPERMLWERPAASASAGFHLKHIAGVLDRLFTYARGEPLSEAQRAALAAETAPLESETPIRDLLGAVDAQVDRALDQLRRTDEATLLEHRGVGRVQLPSTVLGLLFHAAEHTQRHVGQLLVTVRSVQNAGD